MPEGDTIHHAANRIRPVLAGRVPEEIATPHPRFGRDRWPERLAGRRVDAVDAHGKNLFIRFEGGLVVYSHLRMTGWWGVFATGERWRRSPKRAWLRLRAAGHDVVQFDGPVLELMTASRSNSGARTTRRGRSATRSSTSARSPGSGRSGAPRAASRQRSTRGGRRPPSPTTRRSRSSRPSGRGWRAARAGASTRARRASTASRDSRVRGAGRRSARAGRARTTVGHTGVRDARRDPTAPPRAQAHRP